MPDWIAVDFGLIGEHLPTLYRVLARLVCRTWAQEVAPLTQHEYCVCRLEVEAERVELTEPMRAMRVYRVAHLLLQGRLPVASAITQAQQLGIGLVGADECEDESDEANSAGGSTQSRVDASFDRAERLLHRLCVLPPGPDTAPVAVYRGSGPETDDR